ncbi:MAG: HAMP domain-containing histidine kinase [Oscillibacter sp.]|nr:HAMP domain-containing histidine kinase [Oscillibacter sp.]
MIRRLRAKFVAVCMALVTAVLAAVLVVVFFALQHNITNLSDQILHRALQDSGLRYSLEIGGDPVMLPYFTVNMVGSTAYITGGTYDDLENTAALADIISQCLGQEAASGTIPGYNLRYLRQDQGFSRRIAFVDMSMESAMLRQMMNSFLSIAAAALLVLLIISIALAFWITKPVEKAWRQQRQFISDASHELKTPLTVILSNAELLEGTALPGSPGRWVDNIRSEAGQMRDLVEQMLTLARADNAVSTAVFSEVDLSELAMDVCLAFDPVAFEAGKPLEEHIAGGVTVTADAAKLRRLISILLDNAIKYGAAGGSITLSLTKTDRQARLQVENPGEPIPPQQLERLFERFYRADASRGEQSGFGLGLPIAATIAAEHRGTIKAESGDQGTRFTFTMALKKQ